MPEGPEVKSVVDSLQTFIDKKLNDIVVLNGRYTRHKINDLQKLKNKLPLKIKSIDCKGKFIYLEFYDSDFVIFNTLGMGGYWTTENNLKHNNILLKLSKFDLYFNDVRNFGTFQIRKKDELDTKLKLLGPDILSPKNEFDEFYKRLFRRKNKMIAELLMDQKLISGCGNYLRAEVIYLSNIKPLSFRDDLTTKQIQTVYITLKKIAKYKYNGKDPQIKKIYKNRYFLIYGQELGPKNEIIKKIKIKDRTFWYVDN